MRGRLLWALLVLAAVFSMHGITCALADDDATTGSPAAALGSVLGSGHGSAAMPAMPADGAAGPAIAVTQLGGGNATQAPVQQAPVQQAPDHPAGHEGAAHTLMVCLAVLAGGLAALAAWLSRRRRAAPPRVHRTTRFSGEARTAFRVPALHRLCVLRI